MSLITVRAAAERLGVSYSALKQWIYKGTIRTVRTGGGHYRISDGEIDRLLATQGKVAVGRPSRRKRVHKAMRNFLEVVRRLPAAARSAEAGC